MNHHRKEPLIPSEAERRGKLAAEEPGEYVFKSLDDYVDMMGAQIRNSDLKEDAIARQSDEYVKSPSTIHRLAYGQMDRNTGTMRRTKQPRFSTMLGISAALDLEITFRKRRK